MKPPYKYQPHDALVLCLEGLNYMSGDDRLEEGSIVDFDTATWGMADNNELHITIDGELFIVTARRA